MTTILITENSIIADSRSTDDDGVVLSDSCDKVIKKGKSFITICGDALEAERFINSIWFNLGVYKLFKPIGEFSVGKVTKGKISIFYSRGGAVKKTDQTLPLSMGTGGEYAIDALFSGNAKSSEDAVAYAISKDKYSGGKIKTVYY